MLIAGINFATHFTSWRHRSLLAYLRCPEAIPFLTVVLGASLLVSLLLYVIGVYEAPLDALRYGIFTTVSLATTTGYANADYTLWPLGIPLFLLLLSGVATSAGSTGGGIKMVRALLLLKQVRAEMTVMLHPHAVSPVRINCRVVDPKVLSSVAAFMVVYCALLIILSAIMLATGLPP